MFTRGQLIFAIFFVIFFTCGMIWSYRKDMQRHRIYYRHAAKKVGFWGLVIIGLFAALILWSKG